MVKVKIEGCGNRWYIDDFIAKAGYASDLPFEWLESIRFSLKNFLPLCLYIDEYSTNVWILSDEDTFVIDDRDWLKHSQHDFEYHHRVFKIERLDFIHTILPQLEEFIPHLARWDYDPDRTFTPQKAKSREEELHKLFEECRKLLEESLNRRRVPGDEIKLDEHWKICKF